MKTDSPLPFSFTCSCCGEVHEGMPAFAAAAPLSYYEVPESEREARCSLGTDDCVIDGSTFFVRGCIEIRVEGHDEPFSWGVWVSLSEKSFGEWAASFKQTRRAHIGPFFGWLNAWLKPYPNTAGLKTHVHLRDNGIRPLIELEPTDHPLAVDQARGISRKRAEEMFVMMVHEEDA
jgi:hypothetical protein